ncbi:hypothetical protein LLEC1_03804 [Akanthomyces lecanii]|uniref:R3H domain-containing protein n=1 Tax=Cordyceps confragosa TaxID=2714763 RepID=A0A179II45_CORDF|nr:hypothetical protein LLEC1_03804 [Akanthomyces lecanii]
MGTTQRSLAADPVVVVGASHVPNSAAMSLKQSGAVPDVDTTAASLNKLNLDSAASNAAAADKLPIMQRIDSNSDSGTKPPSLDDKSITSGTTFALDEKESLRPDDSASVQAAAEDDDAASLVAGSRLGSEAAAKARARPAIAIGSHTAGILTPQSTSSEQQAENGAPLQLNGQAGSSDALNVIYRQAPDEKLLEALNSLRDRYFLLRLEKEVIDFVENSKEPYMDLPPSNSFCRMLTHNLADYYHMTHSYEAHIGAVRIFRTPFCRVPTSLASMVPQPTPSSSSTPPPVVLPRKIMRRGQEGDSAGASASPSKPGSEAGSDLKQPANQKLSREQREEAYKAARERIFGSSYDSPAGYYTILTAFQVENDVENLMSRTSSASANRSNLGKRGKTTKQRRDSDSFDSRHQYQPYWGPQQQTWVPQPQAQYGPPGVQYHAAGPSNYHVAPHYAQQQAPMYGQVPAMPPNAGYPAYSAGQYPPGGSPVVYAPQTQMPSNTPPHGWQPAYNAPVPYPPQGPPPPGPPQAPNQSPGPTHGPGGIPYPFGQLPANVNPHDPKSQHPIPGSYNRNHAFNPKTQSFSPGVPMPPVHAPQPPFTAPGSHHSSPQIGTPPHLAYTGHQPQMHLPPYGGAYGMARQGSNNSIPSYHGPPHGTPPHVAMQPPQHLVQQPPMPVNSRPPPHGPGPNGQMYSHLPTYGNPATLPQKPNAGI